MRRIWILALCLLLMPLTTWAQVQASLVAVQTSVQPGQPLTVALKLSHQAGWHSFWERAGTGLPTSIEWALPAGWQASPIHWPVPHLVHNSQGEVSGYGYEDVVYLPVTLTAPAALAEGQNVELRATAHWLMCQTLCIPGKQALSLQLPVSAAAASEDSAVVAALAQMAMPEDATGWTLAASRDGREVTLHVAAQGALTTPYFFPLDKFVDYQKAQTVANRGERALLKAALDSEEVLPADPRLRGVLAYTDSNGRYRGVRVDLPFIAAADAFAKVGAPLPVDGAPSATLSLGVLLLALLGGLILNLMPCVFPVLGIKVLGFVDQVGGDRRKVSLHALTFTSGVLASFWALAGLLALLRSGGEQLGWGFQLQSPGFVFVLALVLLVFALNLSGVFEVGARATGIGSRLQTKQGLAGSFFSGVLATVVATPCSAPFLAPALGAALVLPTASAFVVFTTIAIGLSLPYLLLAAFPSLIRLLPRPGAWMETFKQLMAFPLYATVGYLVWVLAGQAGDYGLLYALFALALAALALWFYGRFSRFDGSLRRQLVVSGGAAILLVAAVLLGWPRQEAPDAQQWEAWSPERVEQLQREGRGIYIDFTARWCATCQVNKKLVFGSSKVRDYFREHKIVALKADWTNGDERITRALADHNRSAVPFNLVYRPGAANAKPIVLPEVLTPEIVLQAFKESPSQ